MTKDVILESIDSNVERFILLYWKVDLGATVAQGDELLVVEAKEEKTALTVQAPCSGTLVERVVEEDQLVAVGDILGRIEST